MAEQKIPYWLEYFWKNPLKLNKVFLSKSSLIVLDLNVDELISFQIENISKLDSSYFLLFYTMMGITSTGQEENFIEKLEE